MRRTSALLLAIIAALSLCTYSYADSSYVLDVCTDASYDFGNEVLVTVSLNSISISCGVTFVSFELFYDSKRVSPVVNNDSDSQNGDMLSFLNAPEGWESVSKLDAARGCYSLSYMTDDASNAVFEDGELTVTVPFSVLYGDGKDITFYIGSNLCASFDVKVYSGEGGSATLEKRASQSKPYAPEIIDATPDSVRLKQEDGMQYRCIGEGYDSYWRDQPYFDGLTPDGEYAFYQRRAETSDRAPSAASDPVSITLTFSRLMLKSDSAYSLDNENGYLYTSSSDQYADTVISQFSNTGVTVTDDSGNEVTGLVGTGMQVVLYSAGGTVIDSVTVVVKGDINGDGRINAFDYLFLRRNVMGIYEVSGAYLRATSITGRIPANALDYLMLKRHVMGNYDIYA